MSDYPVSASCYYSMTILEIAVLSEDIPSKHDYCLGTMYGYVTLWTVNVIATSGSRCSVLMDVYSLQKVSHATVYLRCTSLIHDVSDIEWAWI